ncbi:MAG TPA: phospholipase D family protein [Pirellulales bacterium]|nr:phospholipase D family protein [Pirellulales bacterium]
MNNFSRSNSQPFFIVALIMMAIAFAVGYMAGSGGVNLGPGLSPSGAPAGSEDGISVNFSPHGGCTDRVVAEIGKAQSSIEMQAYSFTSQPITDALVAAHHRGVKVTVVLDEKANDDPKERSEAPEIAADKIPTYLDARHSIAHNKIILIDGRTIITGSFNFTKQAERNNAENLLVIEGRPKLAAAYEANFREHLGHSMPFSASTAREPTGSRSFR